LKAAIVGSVMTVRASRRTCIVAFVVACFKINAPLRLDLDLGLGGPMCFCILFINTFRKILIRTLTYFFIMIKRKAPSFTYSNIRFLFKLPNNFKLIIGYFLTFNPLLNLLYYSKYQTFFCDIL
jgi:hypothetical protein